MTTVLRTRPGPNAGLDELDEWICPPLLQGFPNSTWMTAQIKHPVNHNKPTVPRRKPVQRTGLPWLRKEF
ncbi:MAG: hypothetical protein WAX69_24690 [Victivallales bacterium]